MTHWYGWVALAFTLLMAVAESATLVINAWRMDPSPSSLFWIAFWLAFAAALVAR